MRPGVRFSSRQSATSGGSGHGRSWPRACPEWVVRVRRGEKGGRDPTATIGPKTAGHRFQGRGLVAEPDGDLVEWLGLDEDRAEGLVLTLEGLLGLEEEPAGVTPVHDAGSRKLIIFRPETSAERTAKIGAEKGSNRPSPQVGSLENRVKRPKCIGTFMKLRV